MTTLAQRHNITSAIPVLTVPDVNAAVAFYERVLDCTQLFCFGEPPSVAGVLFGEQVQINFFAGELGDVESTWLYMFCDDVDGLADELRRRGADVHHGPEDKPWGLREVGMRDLNGYGVYFGQWLED